MLSLITSEPSPQVPGAHTKSIVGTEEKLHEGRHNIALPDYSSPSLNARGTSPRSLLTTDLNY